MRKAVIIVSTGVSTESRQGSIVWQCKLVSSRTTISAMMAFRRSYEGKELSRFVKNEVE
jgi:hypothetical protein